MNNNNEKKKRRKPEDHWKVRPQVTIRRGTIKNNKTKGPAHFSRIKTHDNQSSYRNRTLAMEVTKAHVAIVALQTKS